MANPLDKHLARLAAAIEDNTRNLIALRSDVAALQTAQSEHAASFLSFVEAVTADAPEAEGEDEAHRMLDLEGAELPRLTTSHDTL